MAITPRIVIKRLFALLVLVVPIVIMLYVTNYPLKKEIEDRITAQLTAQGLGSVEVKIGSLTQKAILFSHIGFTKDKIVVAVDDLLITATALPYRELLRSNYTNLTADWAVKSLTVSGIPYELPEMTGSGNYYMKNAKPVLTGEMHDEKRTHQSEFIVTPITAVLENTKIRWNGATLLAEEVAISLATPKPIYVPLEIRNLPLTNLLTLISSDKATGTGVVSGKAELIIFPDGTFGVGNGRFGAGKSGVIKLSSDALPGDQPQMDIARKALSNFHYTDLSLTLAPDSRGKASIRLNVEGNNPDEFDGRPVKLNVNFTGDVLELLQQTIMPMADPQKLIEERNK